jgi:acyl transferase domain-containing protein
VDSTGRPEPASGYLLPIAAGDPAALSRLAAAYADSVADAGPGALSELCLRAGSDGSSHRLRCAVLGGDRQQLLDRLHDVGSRTTGAQVAGSPRMVFVFPGQGAQRPGMGRELLAEVPEFADRMRDCDRAIQAKVGWSVLEYLHEDEPTAAEGHVQPALWALQVSLAAVWRRWGIEPDVVVGCSMGEIAAAVTTGSLTLDEGAAVVCRRSALIDSLGNSGDMWAVQLSERDTQAAIGGAAGRVCVAAVNSRHFCTISGDAAACREVVASLLHRGVFCRQVKAGLASHSPRMDPILDDLRAQLVDLRPAAGRIPMRSTVQGREMAGTELSGGYWAANLREPVLLEAACRALCAEPGATVFVEVGPQATVTASIQDNVDAADGDALVVPSIRRDQHEAASLLTTLGAVWEQGCEPRWEQLPFVRPNAADRR